MTSEPVLLVADVGGTNTRVGIARGTAVEASSIRRFRNAEHSGLEAVLRAYLADSEAPRPDAAAAAGAGPMQDGVVHLTNLDWTVAPEGIAKATGCKTVSVLNDLQAQGHALPFVAEDNVTRVIEGTATPGPEATRLVIGVGTGLNAALALRVAGKTVVPPSETGHIDLPTPNATTDRLAHWIAEHHAFASAEEALSGRGVAHIFAWACAEAGRPNLPAKPPQEVLEAIAGGQDIEAMKAGVTFATLLGALASSLALIHLPFGGVYLVGGVSRAFGPHLRRLGFAEAFHDKGRFSDYMRQFPVAVVEDDYAALTGCAAHLIDRL